LPFIVFEFVHGRSVKQIVDRLGKLGKPFPVELLVFIAQQTAAGLSYAHVFEDPSTDKILNIIHRDVSPHNIMVSYDGVPKIIDFGIAKVLQRGDQTKAGLIKGKPAYLSPEQALGRPVDGRSDLFSLGTVIWEALTGRRLFGGMDKASTLRAISDQTVVIAPPSMINPSAPAGLDEVVARALERDPAKRFANAREMDAALLKLLEARPLDYWQQELSSLLNNIFSDDIAKEKEHLKKLGAVAEEITRSVISDPSWLIPVVIPANRRPTGFEKTLTREFQIADVTQKVVDATLKIPRAFQTAQKRTSSQVQLHQQPPVQPTLRIHTRTFYPKPQKSRTLARGKYAAIAGLVMMAGTGTVFLFNSGPSVSAPPAAIEPFTPQPAGIYLPSRSPATPQRTTVHKHRQKRAGHSKKAGSSTHKQK
jgi:serine/threonine protein kinase